MDKPKMHHLHINTYTKTERTYFKHLVYNHMAKTISLLGTCRRLKVGCVLLSKEGRVVATGYNGAGPGMDHCQEATCNANSRCLRCSHAEENAVGNLSGKPYLAYVTHEPCANCTRDLLTAGVREIFYMHAYTSMPSEERAARDEWIKHFDVRLVQLPGSKPSDNFYEPEHFLL